jgi:hypothetical protein
MQGATKPVKFYGVWIILLLPINFYLLASEKPAAGKDAPDNPDFFKPGKVVAAEINGMRGYVACASKKKYFPSETARELHSFLQLEAQGHLVRFLSGNQEGEYNYKINSINTLKEWSKGDVFFASFFVPANKIIIEKQAKNTVANSQPAGNPDSNSNKKHTSEIPAVSGKALPDDLILQLERDFLGVSKMENPALGELAAFANASQDRRSLHFLNLRKNPDSPKDLFEIASIYERQGNKQVAILAYANLKKVNAEHAEEIDFKICALHEAAGDYQMALQKYIQFNKEFPFSKHNPFVLKKIVELPMVVK